MLKWIMGVIVTRFQSFLLHYVSLTYSQLSILIHISKCRVQDHSIVYILIWCPSKPDLPQDLWWIQIFHFKWVNTCWQTRRGVVQRFVTAYEHCFFRLKNTFSPSVSYKWCIINILTRQNYLRLFFSPSACS